MISDFRTPEHELKARQDFMRREGYRFCDMPACNCNSWHGGRALARLQDWSEALDELDINTNGTPMLTATVNEIKSLRAENKRMRVALEPFAAVTESILNQMFIGNDDDCGFDTIAGTAILRKSHFAAARAAYNGEG